MKVLLIAFSYPPDPMVGAFRPAKVARAFTESGHEVDVVTGRIGSDDAEGRHGHDRLRVHAIRWIRNPRHLYVGLKQLLLRDSTGRLSGERIATAEVHTGEPPVSRLGAIRQFLISLLWLPDENQGFILPAVWRGLSILRSGGDLIYTTAPPFSDHIAGWILKKLTGRPWVMELRDPWGDSERTMNMRSRPVIAANLWFERKCLAAADMVIAVSPSVHDSLRERMGPSAEGRLFLVLNGIDAIRTEPPGPNGDRPFLILHTGSLYNDPRPFLRSAAAVVNRLGLGPEDIRIEFIGQKPYFTDPTIPELSDALGLAGIVSFSGWIPQAECRVRTTDADLLLLLCEGFSVVVPNKLYDYLGARKPILGIVDPDGETARVLHEQAGHFVTPSADMSRVEAALEQAFQEKTARKRLLNDLRFLERWSTEQQMRGLVGLVNELRNADNTARETGPASPALQRMRK